MPLYKQDKDGQLKRTGSNRAPTRAAAQRMEDLKEDKAFETKQSLQDTIIEKASTTAGMVESARTVASAAIQTPIAGWAGLKAAWDELNAEPEDRSDDPLYYVMKEAVEGYIEDHVYKPNTPKGRKYMEVAGDVLSVYEKYAAELPAEKAMWATGNSPEAGAGVYTTMMLAPEYFGLKGIGKKKPASDIGRRAPDIRDAKKGDNIQIVHEMVNEAREASRSHASALFEQAKTMDSVVATARDINGLPQSIRSWLKADKGISGISLDNMPTVKSLLSDLDELGGYRPASKDIGNLMAGKPGKARNPNVRLNELMEIRQNAARQWNQRLLKKDPKEHMALGIAIKQMDNHIDRLFNSDMMSGQTGAVEKWKRARRAWSDYMKRFEEDKVIRDMADYQASPEAVVNWVLGSSDTNIKVGAAKVVNGIKDIVGKNSNGFRALQNEYLMKVMAPLMQTTPDLQKFVANWQKHVKNNHSVIEALGINTKELEILAHQAKKMKVYRKNHGIDIKRGMAVVFLDMFKKSNTGLSFAKASLQIGLLTKLFDKMATVKDMATKRNMMSEFLYYDAASPLLPGLTRSTTMGTTGAAKATLPELGEELREEREAGETGTPPPIKKTPKKGALTPTMGIRG